MHCGAIVLVVCTGNTCRSAMAQYILKRMLSDSVTGGRPQVRSAGIDAVAGRPMRPEARAALEGLGLDGTRHRSHRLSQQDVDDANIILVMTRRQRKMMCLRFARAKDKTLLLTALGGRPKDIPDPCGEAEQAYVNCAQSIVRGLESGYGCLLERIGAKAPIR